MFYQKRRLRENYQRLLRGILRAQGYIGRALAKIIEEVPTTFTNSMNGALSKIITEKELRGAVNSMAKGEASGHDDTPVKFFQKM